MYFCRIDIHCKQIFKYFSKSCHVCIIVREKSLPLCLPSMKLKVSWSELIHPLRNAHCLGIPSGFMEENRCMGFWPKTCVRLVQSIISLCAAPPLIKNICAGHSWLAISLWLTGAISVVNANAILVFGGYIGSFAAEVPVRPQATILTQNYIIMSCKNSQEGVYRVLGLSPDCNWWMHRYHHTGNIYYA